MLNWHMPHDHSTVYKISDPDSLDAELIVYTLLCQTRGGGGGVGYSRFLYLLILQPGPISPLGLICDQLVVKALTRKDILNGTCV